MTSTTDTAGHPDVTEISDFTEGLLPPARSTDVRRHLDECAVCADVHASLEEIRSLLGTLPGPPRMPADVAGRIDAALAAEALLNASAPELSEPSEESAEGEGSDVGEPVAASPATSHAPGTGTGTHVSRETSTAADRPAGRARASSTGPGRKGRKHGGRRRAAVLGAVLSAAALGLGSVLWTSLTGTQPDTPAQEQQNTAVDTFSETRLEAQVADLLAQRQHTRKGSRTPGGGVESAPASGGPRVLQQPAAEIPECVQQGIGRDEDALATEEGVYEGTDVLLVVLPEASDPARVTAYIVQSTCVDQPSAGAAKVLLEQTYER
ncbi:anti-sigma factor family protein [Streptomyces pharetrae]|uniref:anti-sigma factor family protein n=1 Tax=Streptomyces pharetrae TaxID=291370 RepID=UPI00365F79FA